MIKICYITTIPGAIESFVLKTAESLYANEKWDISFICDADEHFHKMLPPYFHYYPVKMKRGISLSGVRAMLEMKKIFKRERFDLIQYSTPNASLYASLAGKLAGVPVRLYCQWGMAFVGMEGFRRKLFRLEEKLVCKLSTWIEPDSKSNLDFCHREGLYPKNKGSVVGYGSACGVDLHKFDIAKKELYREAIRKQHLIPSESFVFIYVGRITRDKGINELLSAFRSIISERNDVRLLMVGRPEKTETLEKDLYEWSLSCGQIIYTGQSSVVEQYLSAADCYILPSYREGFGMGTIEAEAMGVPVIVTDIPGPIDAMIPNVTGLCVEKKNAAALRDAMVSMMTKKDIGEYGRNGYRFVKEHFDQEILFPLILKDRKKLLGTEGKEKES